MQNSITLKEIYLDIENDEPWYMNRSGEKIETHTMFDRKQEQRDNFFQSKGWIVIRFSEQQIYNDVNKCVDFIFNFIHIVLKPKVQLLNNPLIDHKRWDFYDLLMNGDHNTYVATRLNYYLFRL